VPSRLAPGLYVYIITGQEKMIRGKFAVAR